MAQPSEPVPLADAEIAAGIARAAATGRTADRRPTPEQLVAAFGEPEATDAARRRAASALALAGVRVEPDLLSAPAGERVLLHAPKPPGAAGKGASGGVRRALLGLVAVGAVLLLGAVAASLLGRGDGDDSVGDALPAGTSTATVPALGTPPATTPAATAPPTTAAATQTVPPTTTAEDDAAAERRARERRRARARRRAVAQRRRRTVTVRVDASARPTFLCVEDGEDRQLFGGTLSGRRIFKARVIALNVGLATTVVKYGRRRVTLPGSPAGVRITPRGHTPLALGERPCA